MKNVSSSRERKFPYSARLFVFVVIMLLAVPLVSFGAGQSLAERLSGRILLQVESYGRAWYVHPMDGTRYYLKDGATAYEIMRTLGLGVTNADLEKIPTAAGQAQDAGLASRVAGRILLQVEERGEAWYVRPENGLRYYMKDGAAAYGMMREFSLGISNDDLRAIPMNTTQVVHDTTFDDVAYIQVRAGEVIASQHADQILPPASMTKLMTALVFLDRRIPWDTPVTITESQIAYPRYYAGMDATSEVDIALGDVVTVYDLWVALLVASSNQAAIALVDVSGMTREAFIAAMNEKATALGLTRTVFYDPSGLNAHNVTTPREMAVIAREAFSSFDIYRASQQDRYSFQTRNVAPRQITVTDRNYTLQDFNVDAAKTGFLDEAQRCVSLKRKNDIVVVMHARSMSERNQILHALLD
ncbi:MAG: serine hydrolase [Patescibacteria group bacterium]